MPARPEDLHQPDDEREEEPRQPGEREGEFDGRTFLYIRDTAADDGTAPVPPGVPFWISPDIVVTPPGGSPGGPAQAGAVNDLRVSVTNAGGITAHSAQLDVFLADPSTAFTPATADALATTYVTLPGYNVTDVSLPWSPTASQAGHRCLLARISSVLTGDAVANPAIFDVIGDRHVAQRNIAVMAMAEARRTGFHFLLTNPLPDRATFVLRAGAPRMTRALEQMARGSLCGLAQFGTEPVGVELTANRRAFADALRFELPLGAMHLSPRELEREQGLLARRGTITLAPDEAVHCSLAFSPPQGARPGDVHLVQVAQSDSDRRPVGGLWLALVA